MQFRGFSGNNYAVAIRGYVNYGMFISILLYELSFRGIKIVDEENAAISMSRYYD